MSLHKWASTLEWCHEPDGQQLHSTGGNMQGAENTHQYEPEH